MQAKALVGFLVGLWLGATATFLATGTGGAANSPPNDLVVASTLATPVAAEVRALDKPTHRVDALAARGSNCDATPAMQRSAAFTRMKSRSDLPQLLAALCLFGEGVEIGVNEGEFAEFFMKSWPCAKYHLVDPWTHQDAKVYDDVNNGDQTVQDAKYKRVRARLAQFGERAVYHRGYSVEVSRDVPDASLDFVYVDARHDYDGALEDIRAWWPKLRVGGVMAGHDFVPDGQIKEGKFGVQGAVLTAFTALEREVIAIATKRKDGGREEPQHLDGGWTTFYTIK